jgi:hypothetical protein
LAARATAGCAEAPVPRLLPLLARVPRLGAPDPVARVAAPPAAGGAPPVRVPDPPARAVPREVVDPAGPPFAAAPPVRLVPLLLDPVEPRRPLPDAAVPCCFAAMHPRYAVTLLR